jgi:hypothetical protein
VASVVTAASVGAVEPFFAGVYVKKSLLNAFAAINARFEDSLR